MGLGLRLGLRLRDRENILAVNEIIDLPIIGLTKSHYDNGDVYITPTYNDAFDIISGGANYIAMDATGRSGYDEIIISTNNLVW